MRIRTRGGVGVHRCTSELKFSCLSKLLRGALEVAAELPATVSQEWHRPALAKAGSERVEDAAPGAGFLQNPNRKRLPNRMLQRIEYADSLLGNGVTVAQQTLTLFV